MKMLISDYDRTLFRNEEELLINIKYINNYIKKNMFCIASGRSKQDIENDIKTYNIPFNYLILNHGATIYDKDFKLIKYYLIDSLIANTIYNKVLLNKGIEKAIVYSKNKKDVKEFNNVIKLLFIFSNIEETFKVKEFIDINFSNYIKTYISERHDHITLEVISKNINKSLAINEIKNIENINKKDIYVIGDNFNDIEMIKDYNGYAINTSIKEVKSITTKYCDCVYELIDIINRRYYD